MDKLKLIVAKNIVELRKQHGLTQLQLAEKLNYSDKAVSKWERGESLPDVAVLVEMAKLFSVPLDYLVADENEAETKNLEHKKHIEERQKNIDRNRKAILGICIQAVWIVAIMFFIPISLIFPESNAKWLCFIYAIPLSEIMWLVFNSIWFNRRRNYFIISTLLWSLLASIHITILLFGVQFNLIYLLGIPGELIIVLWSVIAKKPTK